MKMLYLILSISFFSIFPHFSLYSSSFFTKDYIDQLIARVVSDDSPDLLIDDTTDGFNEFLALEKVNLAYPTKLDDEDMLFKFIIACENHHKLRFNSPSLRRFLRSFYTPNNMFFKNYVGGYWENRPELKLLWFKYYETGIQQFFHERKWQECRSLLRDAGKIDPARTLRFLELALIHPFFKSKQFFTNETDEREAAIFIAEAYEDTLNIPNLKDAGFFYQYRFISMLYDMAKSHQKALDFALRAMKSPFHERLPSAQRKPEIDELKGAMLHYYLELEKYDEAIELIHGDGQIKDEYLLYLAYIYSIKKDWATSFQYFKKIFDNKVDEIRLNRPVALSLLEMLRNQNNVNFQKYVRPFLYHIGAAFPEIKENFLTIRNEFKKIQNENISNLIKKTVARQNIELAQSSLESFDKQYKYLLSKFSLVETNMDASFASVNKISQEIEHNFELLREIQQRDQLVRDYSEITRLSDNLRKLFTKFNAASQLLKFEIAEARHRKSQSLMPILEYTYAYIENSESVKAQIVNEQARAEKERQIKENIAKEKKAQRQKNRGESKNPYAHDRETEHSNVLPKTALSHHERLSFKDSSLKQGYEQGDLPTGLLEMLKVLSSATSIYNLYTHLNPGSKFEVLRGDRKGQISLRVNQKYRLCFNWSSHVGAQGVELIDYH